MEHLRTVFISLEKYGLITWKKCTFSVSNVDSLGHNIFENEIKRSETKIRAIKEFDPPER